MSRFSIAVAAFVAVTAVGGCTSDDESSRLGWLPRDVQVEALAATGFEKAALADGRVTKGEMLHGLELQAVCLRRLGYVASVDGFGQMTVVGAAMSDADYDGCAVGNSEILPLAYSIARDGSPEEQRQRQMDCFIEIGELREGATVEEFQRFRNNRVATDSYTEAEWMCLQRAVLPDAGI